MRKYVEMLSVRVNSIKYQGDNLNEYEVVAPDGALLPEYKAGSHIDLFFRDGRCRQYSLCGDPRDRKAYRFAVQRDLNGRGGSIAIFDKVHVGRILKISMPKNNFSLSDDGKKHILLGGGIGITPLMSMLYQCREKNLDFKLYYCTRSAEVCAFRSELEDIGSPERIHIHHDGGVPARALDFREVIGPFENGKHVYYCGPEGFMKAVANVVSDWPKKFVHFERFKAPVDKNPESVGQENTISMGFRVKIASSGQVYVIPSDKSIVDVLREYGVDIETSCEAGLCKTCIVKVLDGVPDHKDYVLTEEEQRDYMLPCCSRASSPLLVLDL